MKTSMHVFLYGINGVYNYGCEATVRSIACQFKKKYPNCTVVYKSFNFESDKIALADCQDVVVSPIKRKTFSAFRKSLIGRGIAFLRRKLGIAKPDEYLNIDTEWLKECDVLVIIGGDIFNLMSTQEHQNAKYNNDRIWVSKVAKANDAKVLLWGISAGPFESNPKAKRIVIDYFINDVDLLIVREEKTRDYLMKNGVTKIVLRADPAFFMKTKSECNYSPNNIRSVGINLSPLANRYLGIDHSYEEWVEVWTERIEQILNFSGFRKAILLPHVVKNDDLIDDDLSYLQKIQRELTKDGYDSEIVSSNPGFMGIKTNIEQCDIVFSARMHGAVNAVTCAVPTVFLVYSSKAVGMCKFVYGKTDMVLDMKELAISGVQEDWIISLIGLLPQVKQFIELRSVELSNDAGQAIEDIQKKVFMEDK